MKLPQYKCHKVVGACKIAELSFAPDGACYIVPEDSSIERFTVSTDYRAKHQPQPGGYYVVYEGGYESFSPADVFEGGYSIVEERLPHRS